MASFKKNLVKSILLALFLLLCVGNISYACLANKDSLRPPVGQNGTVKRIGDIFPEGEQSNVIESRTLASSKGLSDKEFSKILEGIKGRDLTPQQIYTDVYREIPKRCHYLQDILDSILVRIRKGYGSETSFLKRADRIKILLGIIEEEARKIKRLRLNDNEKLLIYLAFLGHEMGIPKGFDPKEQVWVRYIKEVGGEGSKDKAGTEKLASNETSLLVQDLKEIFAKASVSPEKPGYNYRGDTLTLSIKRERQDNSSMYTIQVVPGNDYRGAFKDIDKILVVMVGSSTIKITNFNKGGTLIFENIPPGNYEFKITEPKDANNIRDLYVDYQEAQKSIVSWEWELEKEKLGEVKTAYTENFILNMLLQRKRELKKITNDIMEILDKQKAQESRQFAGEKAKAEPVDKKLPEVAGPVSVVDLLGPASRETITRQAEPEPLKRLFVGAESERLSRSREKLMKILEARLGIRQKLTKILGDRVNLELIDIVARVEDGNTKYGMLFLYRIRKSAMDQSFNYILVDTQGKVIGSGRLKDIYQIYFEQKIMEVERLRSMVINALGKILRTVNSGL